LAVRAGNSSGLAASRRGHAPEQRGPLSLQGLLPVAFLARNRRYFRCWTMRLRHEFDGTSIA